MQVNTRSCAVEMSTGGWRQGLWQVKCGIAPVHDAAWWFLGALIQGAARGCVSADCVQGRAGQGTAGRAKPQRPWREGAKASGDVEVTVVVVP
jgi:hypothetical protein